MNRRRFIKRGALAVPMIFIPRLIRAQTVITSGTIQNALLGQSVASGGGGSIPFITSVTGGSNGSLFSGRVGFKFTPSAALTVTDLGCLVLSGMSGTRTLYITDDSCASIIISAPVTISGSVGTFAYASITPTVLNSGTIYQVQRETDASSDAYLNDDCTISTTGDGVVSFSTYNDGTCHPNSAGVFSYGVPNFKYHL